MQTRHTVIESPVGELTLVADGDTLVVGRGGTLTGYAGGLKRKRFLLDLEEPAPALAGKLF